MNEPGQLVEHFFRHEYGRLVGLLTRSFGVRHLELVEDAVQMALWQALHHWSRHGVPATPAAWLFRTARNLTIDSLRRESAFHKAQQVVAAQSLSDTHGNRDNPAADDGALDSDIGDASLRLLFLCCHPKITTQWQVALALKIVCGFSVQEIASGLLTSTANIEKRLTRAKSKLREIGEEISQLSTSAMQARLDAVLIVCYLMFNEGFFASQGESAIKRDLCEESVRLARMLATHPDLSQQPTVAALLALMLLHSARLSTRVDAEECLVLLADQDRSAWDWSLIREAMQWMLSAARGEELSRYHIEAAIAWEHCRAASLAETDWPRVYELYQWLAVLVPSPTVRLNSLIAKSYMGQLSEATQQLRAMTDADRRQLRPWWDCTMAHFLERSGDPTRAGDHWRDALALAGCSASRKFIEKCLTRLCSSGSHPSPDGGRSG